MDSARVWVVRIVAPVAFLVAATVLVILVQHALRDDSSSSKGTTPVTASSTSAATTGSGSTQRRYYRIKAGDTLESIASQAGTSVEHLLQLNPGIDPLSLTPKQRIRIS